MAQRSDLPFGSEFSPSQIELPILLDLAVTHEGDSKALQTAIQSRFFSKHGGGNAKNQRTLAMNCRLGMKAYGLIDDDANLTEFGQELLALRHDDLKLYETLARHILLNLKGMAMVQCIRDMTAAVTCPLQPYRSLSRKSGGKVNRIGGGLHYIVSMLTM